MSSEHTVKAVRGKFLDITRVVTSMDDLPDAVRLIDDGLMLIRHGKIEWFGQWEDGKHLIRKPSVSAITPGNWWCRALLIPTFTIRRAR